ncbi:DUF805 domain-containing protein [Psittacicella gerlachiana]|uniref:DUF805 domain-containing protein n=1 Tax=Psittacicella gerlachiana TaxID=2028574 RepID=A0A3A1Y2G3_9GAMM|nr:DUF805 domain-containing protein [Psittacicella gerlachiana]RIY31398.1 hypothetical protein CKF59_07675 [Psittacicella gerlachiana]
MTLKTLPFFANAKLHLKLMFEINYRENRLSYFYSILAFNVIIPLVLSLISLLLTAGTYYFSQDHEQGVGLVLIFGAWIILMIVNFIISVIVLILSITSGVRRLHDLGKSGMTILWVYLIGIVLSILVVGVFIIMGFHLYLLFARTKEGAHPFSELDNPFLVER